MPYNSRVIAQRLPETAAYVVPSIAVLLLITGCDLPRDPEQTLARVRGGTLRVGVSARAPWTDWKENDGARHPTGIEVELIERIAQELDARVSWVRGSETELLTSLENFELDVVAAGLTDDTLWSDRVGLSRSYAETAEGKHVLAVQPGENAFLLQLDTILAEHEADVRGMIGKETSAKGKAATP